MNVYKFPFDKQSCSLIIGSWFQNNQLVNLKIDTRIPPIDKDFVKNPVWEFVISESRSYVKNSSRLLSTDYKASDVHFVASFKRGPLYYMINNVYPCLILNVVTLLTFFLPFALQASLSN